MSGLTATAGDGQVTLTWSKPPDSDLEHIEITWSPDGGAPQSIDPQVESFTASDLTNGTPYEFTVVTVDGAGNASGGATATETPESPLLTASDDFGTNPHNATDWALYFNTGSAMNTNTSNTLVWSSTNETLSLVMESKDSGGYAVFSGVNISGTDSGHVTFNYRAGSSAIAGNLTIRLFVDTSNRYVEASDYVSYRVLVRTSGFNGSSWVALYEDNGAGEIDYNGNNQPWMNDMDWHNVTMSYGKGTVDFVVDGTTVVSGPFDPSLVTKPYVSFEGYNGGGGSMEKIIDNVTVQAQ